MMTDFGWAKNPMLNRMHELREDKPITLLYGSRSWIDKSSWDLVKQARLSSFVNTQVKFINNHYHLLFCRWNEYCLKSIFVMNNSNFCSCNLRFVSFFLLFCSQVISGAGHHIFADKPEVFNDYVNAACRISDKLPDNDLRKLFTNNNNNKNTTTLQNETDDYVCRNFKCKLFHML